MRITTCSQLENGTRSNTVRVCMCREREMHTHRIQIHTHEPGGVQTLQLGAEKKKRGRTADTSVSEERSCSLSLSLFLSLSLSLSLCLSVCLSVCLSSCLSFSIWSCLCYRVSVSHPHISCSMRLNPQFKGYTNSHIQVRGRQVNRESKRQTYVCCVSRTCMLQTRSRAAQ